MKNFRDLHVWERAHQLVLMVYRITAAFPGDERYGLVSQMRRCGASIPANIAEGCGKDGDPELARFVGIAMGSASELEYFVILAHDLGYVRTDDEQLLMREVTEIKRMLTSLFQKLKANR